MLVATNYYYDIVDSYILEPLKILNISTASECKALHFDVHKKVRNRSAVVVIEGIEIHFYVLAIVITFSFKK